MSAPKPGLFHHISGTNLAPWEIGRAQKPIVELVDAGVFDGKDVLDVSGQGIGINNV
jgi:hypothetical protein